MRCSAFSIGINAPCNKKIACSAVKGFAIFVLQGLEPHSISERCGGGLLDYFSRSHFLELQRGSLLRPTRSVASGSGPRASRVSQECNKPPAPLRTGGW